MKIKLTKPYLLMDHKKCKLCCDTEYIVDNQVEKNLLFFEVDTKYKEYLYYEGCEAFIVALIPYLQKYGCDIEIDGPVGSEFFFNFQKMIYSLNNIKSASIKSYLLLKGCNFELVDEEKIIKGENVGTGFSCGVDSFHTLANCLFDNDSKNTKINSLTYFNIGSHEGGDEEYVNDLFIKRRNRVLSLAEQLKLPLIFVESNIHKIYEIPHQFAATYRNIACVFAVKKYFKKYYLSSGFTLDEFSYELETAKYDCYVMMALSTSNLQFYVIGSDSSRLEKIKYISNFDFAVKHLDVCIREYHNCGICEKCRRTMLALWSIDKLDDYCNVFDVAYFHNHKRDFYGYLVLRLHFKHNLETYKEIKNNLKKGKKFNLFQRIASYPWALKHAYRFLMKKIKK